jgi:hypothetical protein
VAGRPGAGTDARADHRRDPRGEEGLAMRNRHRPRVCRHCHGPMASGVDTCWRCGTQWATEAQPPATLHLVADPFPGANDRPAPVRPAAPRVAAVSVRS